MSENQSGSSPVNRSLVENKSTTAKKYLTLPCQKNPNNRKSIQFDTDTVTVLHIKVLNTTAGGLFLLM